MYSVILSLSLLAQTDMEKRLWPNGMFDDQQQNDLQRREEQAQREIAVQRIESDSEQTKWIVGGVVGAGALIALAIFASRPKRKKPT